MVKKSQASQGKVYIVEDIVDTKLSSGTQHYRVKWKGYSYSECTWQPEQSFNCSKSTLNQFLIARALKQPAFKQKILKIQKERDSISKTKGTPNNGAGIGKLIQENERNDALVKKEEEKKKSLNDKSEQKYENKEKLKIEKKIIDKTRSTTKLRTETNQKQNSPSTQKKRIIQQRKQNSFSVEAEKNEAQSKQKYQKPQNSGKTEKTEKKSVQKAINTTKKSSNENSNNVNHPTQIQPESEFDVLLAKKQGGQLKFYVLQNGVRAWKSQEEMHTKYAIELCRYYQKHLCFYEQA